MCKFKVGQQVCYLPDKEPNHVYVVTAMPNDNPCTYEIELITDTIIHLNNVPESYMTDTIDGNGEITPEPSASS